MLVFLFLMSKSDIYNRLENDSDEVLFIDDKPKTRNEIA